MLTFEEFELEPEYPSCKNDVLRIYDGPTDNHPLVCLCMIYIYIYVCVCVCVCVFEINIFRWSDSVSWIYK